EHVRGDKKARDDGKRILPDEKSVLERSRLALGRVADHGALAAGMFAQRSPFRAGRVPRAAATTQTGTPELLDDDLRFHDPGQGQRRSAAVGQEVFIK